MSTATSHPNTHQPSHSGSLFVIIAPSGAGKSSLVKALLEVDDNILLSISHTTRAPRAGEAHGMAYYFTDAETFLSMRAAGGFLESAEVHGNYYGTSKEWILSALSSGKDVLLEIDWQGALQVREHFPEMVGVFILPPSMKILEERLRRRGTDSEEVIIKRLAAAQHEMAHASEFEYVIINQDFQDALAQLRQVAGASRLRFALQAARHSDVFEHLGVGAKY